MKNFILKTVLFVLPFVLLFVLNVFFYNPEEGDLVRLGYLFSNSLPKSIITDQYNLPKSYTLLSEIDLKTKNDFKIITIGDSFSEQDSLGYKNFIANNGVSVLHIDDFISEHKPIQTIIQLLNSNFFDYVSAEYIVLQSVEREFNQRTKNINFDLTIDLDSTSIKVEKHVKKMPDYKLQFFSDVTIKAVLSNILYFFSSKPFLSQTYKYDSDSNKLFSNSVEELLFYQDDIKNMNIKNNSLSILNSIRVLEKVNDLALDRGIKLIVLVSPDKYDLYYPYISDNESLIEPLFFSVYEQKNKKYVNIDSYKILSDAISKESDIYFYDDTHWSPKGAKIIADKIYDIITK